MERGAPGAQTPWSGALEKKKYFFFPIASLGPYATGDSGTPLRTAWGPQGLWGPNPMAFSLKKNEKYKLKSLCFDSMFKYKQKKM